jgi:hypothetical protein
VELKSFFDCKDFPRDETCAVCYAKIKYGIKWGDSFIMKIGVNFRYFCLDFWEIFRKYFTLNDRIKTQSKIHRDKKKADNYPTIPRNSFSLYEITLNICALWAFKMRWHHATIPSKQKKNNSRVNWSIGRQLTQLTA